MQKSLKISWLTWYSFSACSMILIKSLAVWTSFYKDQHILKTCLFVTITLLPTNFQLDCPYEFYTNARNMSTSTFESMPDSIARNQNCQPKFGLQLLQLLVAEDSMALTILVGVFFLGGGRKLLGHGVNKGGRGEGTLFLKSAFLYSSLF